LARWANSKSNMQSPSQKFQQNGSLDDEISKGHKNLVEQSKRFRRHMEEAKTTAAEPTEIREILGQALNKLKPTSEEEEGQDGQQDLHRH